jgi:hypothetical protein
MPKQLNLPKKIRVGNRWYSVDVVESMRNKSEMGRVHYERRTIELAQRTHHGVPFRLSALEDTFWHELTHAILHSMGEHELNNRESFVEEFARRLSAAIRTARF